MKLHVEGMTCNHCVKSVSDVLEAKGATNIDVSLEGKYVEFQPQVGISVDAYIHAIEDIGFDAKQL